jgi:hypothetical protein
MLHADSILEVPQFCTAATWVQCSDTVHKLKTKGISCVPKYPVQCPLLCAQSPWPHDHLQGSELNASPCHQWQHQCSANTQNPPMKKKCKASQSVRKMLTAFLGGTQILLPEFSDYVTTLKHLKHTIWMKRLTCSQRKWSFSIVMLNPR